MKQLKIEKGEIKRRRERETYERCLVIDLNKLELDVNGARNKNVGHLAVSKPNATEDLTREWWIEGNLLFRTYSKKNKDYINKKHRSKSPEFILERLKRRNLKIPSKYLGGPIKGVNVRREHGRRNVGKWNVFQY